jgi:RHS repeat-associated protein
MIKKVLTLFVCVLFFLIPFSVAENFNFVYDDNGNLLDGISNNYEYDSFNQLSKVLSSNGELLEEYTYDPDGNRIKKVEYLDSGIQTTYYPSKNLVRVVNSSGTFDTIYIYDGETLLARKDSNGEMFYYHPDHLGSNTLITDSNGATVEETSYLPYGDVLSGGNDRFTYTGQEKDSSGLMYYGARYYDPVLRQFTQPDTIIADYYDPQNLNRYSYVLNNPYKYTDPSGHYSCNFGSGCISLDLFGFHITIGNVQYDEGDAALNNGQFNYVTDSVSYEGQWKTNLVVGAGLMGVGTTEGLANAGKSPGMWNRVKRWFGGNKNIGSPKGNNVVKGPGDVEVGRFVVDTKGNALIEPKGGFTKGKSDGSFINTHFDEGGAYQQYHLEHNSPLVKGPHGHTMIKNTQNPAKSGYKIDINGNQVADKTDAAHWYNVK